MTSISVSVLKRIVRSLPAPPLHGIHHWIMGTARRCRNKRLSEEHTTVIIAAFEDKCRRPYKPQEVENAVGKAFSTSLNSKADTVKSFSWRSDITAGLVARDYKSEDDWRARSVANPEMLDPRDIIQLTLDPDPDTWICIAQRVFSSQTRRFRDWKDLKTHELIVPAWMTAEKGITQKGKESFHTLENTGERRFIVVDLDDPPSAQHATILWNLATIREPSLVLKTGGKGLHGWFPAGADDERFWDYALILGADVHIKNNRSSFVRLPNGTRSNGRKQEVIFLNPNLPKS